MSSPVRIQLSRAKGWRMPPNTVKVDRSTIWGNPWSVDAAEKAGFAGTEHELRDMCVNMFRNAMARNLPVVATITARIAELRGKNLACWCKPGSPCHADVLLELANAPDREAQG